MTTFTEVEFMGKVETFPVEPSRTTARFWVYINSTVVKIKLRKGQELSWAEGGQTDEGFSYTGHCWSFDGEEVFYNIVTNACDCDGPISHGSSVFCKVDELRDGSYLPDDEFNPFARNGRMMSVVFPRWQERGRGWQRDHNAEAAGY